MPEGAAHPRGHRSLLGMSSSLATWAWNEPPCPQTIPANSWKEIRTGAMAGRGSAHMARGCLGSFSLVIFHFCLPPPQSRERVPSVWWGVKVKRPPSLGQRGAVTDGCPLPPYLVSPDERLHRQVILHQLVHVGLGLHQGPRSGHS